MQADIDKILRNLGVLAELKQNDKLLTEGEFFTIYVPTAMRSLWRLFYRESRETNMLRVSECIRNGKMFVATAIGDHGMKGEDTEADRGSVPMRFHRLQQVQICGRVLTALANSVHGLDNLMETYHEDAALVVRIRQLKTEVTDFIESTQVLANGSKVVQRLQ